MPRFRYEVIGVDDMPEVRRGDDLAPLVTDAARRQGTPLAAGDLLVVSQKIVSKAEGRVVRLSEVVPSERALAVAEVVNRDPRLVEVILSESRRVVRQARDVLIVETHHGFVCANAGVDQSNVDADTACLLPIDSDASARALRDGIAALTGHRLAIVIADTFGRPWREGLVNIAVGVAGVDPLKSYLGEVDPGGHVLQATVLAVADELAGGGRACHGQARPHPRRDRPRARVDARRGQRACAPPRSLARPVPLVALLRRRSSRSGGASGRYLGSRNHAARVRCPAVAGLHPGARGPMPDGGEGPRDPRYLPNAPRPRAVDRLSDGNATCESISTTT